MKISPTGYSNPLRSFQRKLSPDYASREFRDPGLRNIRRATETGLGSLKKTMPHLRPGKMDSGGPISRLYASAHPNLYNPDQMARQILAAGRKAGSQFVNPDFRAMPGSTAGFPYADGGEATDPPGMEELLTGGDEDQSGEQQQQKQIVIEAMLALEGRHPDPKAALEAFVAAFGDQALAELKQMMASRPDDGGEEPDADDAGGPPDFDADDLKAAGGGLLAGPGSGQSDEIKASTPSGHPVLLSDGEYVIDAPTVAALGDGSTSAGARRLDDLRKQIRTRAYGHDKQAKPMAKGGAAIVVKLGG